MEDIILELWSWVYSMKIILDADVFCKHSQFEKSIIPDIRIFQI